MAMHRLTVCDRDCAAYNACRIGGYQCPYCGEWFCPNSVDADMHGRHKPCAVMYKAEVKEAEDGE